MPAVTTNFREFNCEIILQQLLRYSYYDKELGGFVRTAQSSTRFKQPLGALVGTPNRDGYLTVNLIGRMFFIHHLVWAAEHRAWPSENLDHYNKNNQDNRIQNLREANQVLNGANKRLYKNNKTGYMGVSYSAELGKYKSSVASNGKQHHCGYFPTAKEAYEARRALIAQHPEWGFTDHD